jgi:hypothetical protein
MLVYKCDGESYSTGNKCKIEVQNELPTWWLSITGKIINGLYDAHYVECNGVRHFCSRRCLENFLFKDVNPASGQSGVDNTMKDPNVKNEEAQQEAAAGESAAQDTAMEAKQESAEEGTTEG